MRKVTPTVGSLPYAALATPRSPRARNGALVAYNWGLDDISLRPVSGSEWTSPASGETYFMKWRLDLRGSSPSRRGKLTLTAVDKNSEVNFAGRSAYEGLFRYRNDPYEFKVRRRAGHRGRQTLGWHPLPKGVELLPRYATVPAAANHRYLDALAVVDDPAPAHQALDRLVRPLRDPHPRACGAPSTVTIDILCRVDPDTRV